MKNAVEKWRPGREMSILQYIQLMRAHTEGEAMYSFALFQCYTWHDSADDRIVYTAIVRAIV